MHYPGIILSCYRPIPVLTITPTACYTISLKYAVVQCAFVKCTAIQFIQLIKNMQFVCGVDTAQVIAFCQIGTVENR